MSTLTRTEFVNRNADKSIDLAKTKASLQSSHQAALKKADLNGDGKIEGAKELGQAFKNMDDFDRNGSRTSVNVGSEMRPTNVGKAFKAIEKEAKPRRGLGGTGGTDGTGTVNNGSGNRPGEGVAQINRTKNAGARNQMVEGKITVNGNTYDFRSGGHGRGSLPKGTYNITRHLDSRSDASMSVGGVGYSFAMSDKFDSRVGDTRKLLRIHPDGRSPGTEGCLGIVGDAATQRRFREDMLSEIRRNGGSYQLTVR